MVLMTLVIDAGHLDHYFQDDIPVHFRSNPHFLHYCPCMSPGHLLVLEKTKKPRLIYVDPRDFWHKLLDWRDEFWVDSFDIEVVDSVDKAWSFLQRGCVVFSSQIQRLEELGCTQVPKNMLFEMDWGRVFKTEYELECIKRANQRASIGHISARNSFFHGGSEFEIHCEFMKALECSEGDLPYRDIIAIDENSATLHYEFKDPKKKGVVFLIDAGARYNGYCSDITRTYATDKAHPIFRGLLNAMETCQKDLCHNARVGMLYGDLHLQGYRRVTEILLEYEVIHHISVERAVTSGLTQTFFPHGLGHSIGLQTHDVAGRQISASGEPGVDLPGHPHLRTLRPIQDRDVLTIEPGLYFIPMLLEQLRGHSHINWELVDELISCGGIRIEDEICVKVGGVENLTRPFLG